MPQVGYGLWKLEQSQCAETVEQAIKLGYRHFDSASDYGNEVETGQGIKNAIKKGHCSREDLWITSKLWNTHHQAEHVELALDKSLEDLGLDYLDLYLVHFPIAMRYVPIDTRYPAGWFYDPDTSEPKAELARVPLMETWQAMENLVESGKVKRIGVCNYNSCLSYTSPSPRDRTRSRMPSSA